MIDFCSRKNTLLQNLFSSKFSLENGVMLFDNQLILVSIFYRTIMTETTTEVAFWEILFVKLLIKVTNKVNDSLGLYLTFTESKKIKISH